MELTEENLKIEEMGHLGLVAAMIKELGIDKKISDRLPISKEKGGIVEHGYRVASMILNGLGFVNRTLYLSPHFFENKPLSLLLAPGIESEHLNDDCLGRCLDEIAPYGTTKLFSEIMFEIVNEQGLESQNCRTDTTSFKLFGSYDFEKEEKSPHPTYGYSKDHRPDLKLVTLSLTQMGPAQIPIWMEALDGNSSDKESFQETVRKIQKFSDEVKKAPDNFFCIGCCFLYSQKVC